MSFSMLPLGQVTRDASLQLRTATDEDTVAEYAAWLTDNPGDLPPVECVREGAVYWLWSGYHRLAAYIAAGRKKIPVNWQDGTKRNAWLKALGANATHGLKRTNADKRRAVTAALEDEELSKQSDRAIAETCGVYHQMVSEIRRKLLDESSSWPRERVNGKNGREMRNPAYTKARQTIRHDPPHTTRAPIRQQEEAEVPFDQLEETVGTTIPPDVAEVIDTGMRQLEQGLEAIDRHDLARRIRSTLEAGLSNTPSPRNSFRPPSLEEVAAYCRERGKGIDPEQWYDHYTANGWKVGRNPMKDWRAAVRTWEKYRDFSRGKKAEPFSGIKEWLESQEGEQ